MSFLDYNWTPILFPFLVGILNYKKLNRACKVLFIFVGYGVFNEVVGFILRDFFAVKNTMPQGNLYYIIEFLLLGIFYMIILSNKVSKKLFLLIIILFEIYSIFNVLYIQNIWEYPSIPQTISKLVFIICTLLFFHNTMLEAKIKNLWSEPLIFINVAVLIYYSGNLFFSLLFQYILEYSNEFSKLTVQYFSILNALFYVLIAIGFYKAGKQKNTSLK